MLIGKVLDATNQDIVAEQQAGLIDAEQAATMYNYTAPLVMLACLGVAALLIGIYLKYIDKKEHLGLELPNIASKDAEEAEMLAAED